MPCLFHRKLQFIVTRTSVGIFVFYVCCTLRSFVLFGLRGDVTDVGQIYEDTGGCGGCLSVKLLLSR